MKIYIFIIYLFLIYADARRHNEDTNGKSHVNKDYLEDIDENERETSKVSHEKKTSSRKKTLEDIDDSEKPSRRIHSAKSTNSSKYSKSNIPSTTTPESYIEEASLCINEFDVKSEQLVKVKELKNGAYMIRFVQIEEPSVTHGLDIRDICMLNCCVEKNCDLAMLSEQRTNDGYKCYLFSCNGSCTYAPHQDYTSMILKKDLSIDDDVPISSKQSTKNNEKSSDASSSVISTTCRSSEFSCRDGSCIPYYDVCNSYEDCPSGIDEAMCTPANRKKPPIDIDTDANTDIDEILDETEDEETTTVKSKTKTTSTKSPLSKNKSKNNKQNTSFLYNIDLETQERVSKLQKLKEHLEDTKGPEAWYHLYQTLVQHQQQDHSNTEPEQTGSSSSSNDDDTFKDHLLALEQQWIADRQKTSSTTTVSTTIRSRGNIRKPSTTTTKRMKIINNDDTRIRRPPSPAISSLVDDDLTDEEDDDGTTSDDNERYYYQPTYDDRQRNRYGYPQKPKTTTRKSKTRYQQKENTESTLLRATQLQSDGYSHAGLLLRESTVILIFLLGLIFTIILLVLVGFYCRDSWKRGRIIKNRSTDADYLINGLYL